MPHRSLILVCLLAIASCGDGSSPNEPPPPPPPAAVASVAVAPDTATLVPLQQRQLGATVRDAAGNSLSGRSVSWSSSNEGVATVTASGMVNAVGAGTTTVTATSEGRSGMATVTVREGQFIGQVGGTLTVGVLTVTVPAGAVTTGTAFTAAVETDPPAHPKHVPGSAWNLGPSGIGFAQPVRVQIGWSSVQESGGALPEQFVVHRWNGTSWEALSGREIDLAARHVSGLTDGFSTFGIIEVPSHPAPSLTAIEPASVVAGSGALALAVTGTGFTAASEVRWNGAPRATTFVSATELTAQVSAADVDAVGTADVTVFNPAPGGGLSDARVFTVMPVPPGEPIRLITADSAANDQFGRWVAAGPNTIVVGAWGAGTAYVFERVGGQWTQTAKLTGDGGPTARFGRVVDIHGNTIVVGEGPTPNGNMYIFERIGGTWQRTAKLASRTGRVAIHNDRILATAPTAGTVGVIEHAGGTWQSVASFGPPSQDNGAFGSALALYDDYAIIGSSNGGYPEVPHIPKPWGQAFLYELQNGTWTEVKHLLNPDGDDRGFSQDAVAIHGGRAAVGDFRNQNSGLEGVHTYSRQPNGTWEADAILRMPGDDCFGYNVDMYEDLLVVGTCRATTFSQNTGRAYAYRWSGSAWTLLATLEDPESRPANAFGFRVAAGPDFIVVGASGGNVQNVRGSVYVYPLQP